MCKTIIYFLFTILISNSTGCFSVYSHINGTLFQCQEYASIPGYRRCPLRLYLSRVRGLTSYHRCQQFGLGGRTSAHVQHKPCDRQGCLCNTVPYLRDMSSKTPFNVYKYRTDQVTGTRCLPMLMLGGVYVRLLVSIATSVLFRTN